ncbi:uncharacterized protein LOC144153828 [Haemaphysalis longicornis]
MNRQPKKANSKITTWQWNANGFHCRKATLLQIIQSAEKPPDVIMVQETHAEDAPSLSGYRAHASPPSARACGKGAAQGVCTFVRRGIPFVKHEDLLGRSALEYCATEVLLGKKKKESILLLNVYSNPAHRQQKFRTMLHKTLAAGRELLDEAADAGFTLHTDPSAPTRIGTSVTRDTNPDLTFVRAANTTRGVKWRNTGQNMGSDHFVIEIELPTSARHRDERDRRRQKITDWNLFRARVEEEGPARDITDIENWTSDVVRLAKDVTTEHDVDEDCPGMDNRLAHMLEARRSMQKRWRGKRNNHRLRKRIATLGREIEKYSRELCTQRWHAVCNEADGQLHNGRTWKLLRHLLDETGTKGYQQHRLAQVIHAATKALGEEETRNRIDTKYLPSTPVERHGEYAGVDNPALDRDIEEWEVRAVLQSINCKSAAGPDGITNKALRNLGDGAIASLTTYFNRCWRSGTLPKQWKTAKTVSSLGMGRRSYEYIRDFLSERTITIHAGDLQLPPKKLGSTGTPQGSVISPLLFNLVLIGVARRLSEIPQILAS